MKETSEYRIIMEMGLTMSQEENENCRYSCKSYQQMNKKERFLKTCKLRIRNHNIFLQRSIVFLGKNNWENNTEKEMGISPSLMFDFLMYDYMIEQRQSKKKQTTMLCMFDKEYKF